MAKDNNALAARIDSQSPGKTVSPTLTVVHDQLKKATPALEKVLPPGWSAERFMYVVYSQVRKNPDLMACKPESIVMAAIGAAELGLDFAIRNEVFMVPYSGQAQRQL